ncbi:hypothetical protein D3C81_1354620 [compost metagenome]
MPTDRQIVLDRRRQHRDRLVDTVDQVAKQLQRFGEHHAVLGLIHTKAIRRIVTDDRLNITCQFHQLFDSLFLLGTELVDVGRLLHETLTGHDRTIDHRQVQLVLHDALRGQHAHILVGHVLVESLPVATLALQRAATTDVMHPEGDVDEIRRAQRLQQPIERVVPVLQLPLLAPHER